MDREGDGAAPGPFEEIVERYREPLTAWARSLLRDRGHAEDAVQETFLHAYRHLHALRDPDRLRPWLYAILENRVHSTWRHDRRRPVRLIGDAQAVIGGEPVEPAAPEPAAEPEETPLRAEVRAAFDGLPPAYRDALSMHYLEGHSASSMARTLGLTLNNAKVRLFRARNRLRRDLKARGVDAPVAGAPAAGARP